MRARVVSCTSCRNERIVRLGKPSTLSVHFVRTLQHQPFLFSNGGSILFFFFAGDVFFFCVDFWHEDAPQKTAERHLHVFLNIFQAPVLHSSAWTFRDASGNSGQNLVRTWVNLSSGSVI